jgi:fatty acid desaturase
MCEHSISEYARALRHSLPGAVFRPAPRRALFLLLHLGIIAGGLVAIGFHWGGWPARIALSLLVGHSFAGAAFVAHETLHGSVVHGRRARSALGALGFLPFAISPTLWIAWHNRVHHGHTGQTGVDPDTYPTLARYRESRAIRIVDRLSLGGRRCAGLLTLLLGFTGQSLLALRESAAFGLTRRQRRAAILHTLFSWAFWVGIGVLLGPIGFIFGFVVPLMVGNTIVMAYILTNHSLMPLTEVNDPLLNSLSVTAPRVVEALHLNFGFHVEHHLFPAMSPRHARLLRRLLQERWPDRYQSMPIGTALRHLWTTPRIYEDPTTLIQPRSGERRRTLIPRERDADDDSFRLPGARLSYDRRGADQVSG